MQYYPKICRRDVSIHVIQSGEHILNTVSGVIDISSSLIPNSRVSVFRSNFQICRGRLGLYAPLSFESTQKFRINSQGMGLT